MAAAYLRQQGLSILARNVRSPMGEIDLIALDGVTVVFIEVRLRSQQSFGGAAASITPRKQQRIIQTARHWLHGTGRRYARHLCRFDALLLDELNSARMEWLRDAFQAG